MQSITSATTTACSSLSSTTQKSKPHQARSKHPPIVWYDPRCLPASQVGYVYIVHLVQPYVKGHRLPRIGGHLVRQRKGGQRKLVGGQRQPRPQTVYNYVGWSLEHPWMRFDDHLQGKGARLLAYLADIGWPMELVAATPGGRDLEARIKRWHNNRLACPECRAQLRLAHILAASQPVPTLPASADFPVRSARRSSDVE